MATHATVSPDALASPTGAAAFLAETTPLSGVVSRLRCEWLGGRVGGRVNDSRRYKGSLTTSSRVSGCEESSSKTIHYAIMRRYTSPNFGYLDTEDTPQIPQTIDLLDVQCSTFRFHVTRYMNVAPDYVKADLSATIFHLAAGLAQYALTGRLSSQMLRRGTELALHDFKVAAAAMSIHNCVSIPRDKIMQAPEVFTALVLATNAAGSATASNNVCLSSNTNAAPLPVFQNADLAYGCLWGLRTLFNQYKDAGASAVAALAFVKGIHSVATVQGHTDEGGYNRDVLRHGKFVAPYGGVVLAGLIA